MKVEGDLADAIPEGYEIFENPNAQVFLRKKQPKLTWDSEKAIIEQHLPESPGRFLCDIKGKTVSILEAVVNNAGIMIARPISELSLEDWNKVVSVNITGIFLTSKHGAPYLRERQGSIVNTASTGALMPEPNTEAYSASKGGFYFDF